MTCDHAIKNHRAPGVAGCPACASEQFVALERIGETSGSWWHETFNPWWGCAKVSPACTNCYAEKVDARRGGIERHWGLEAPRRFLGDDHWNKPLAWDRAAKRAGARLRVFCASMCDVFEHRRDLDGYRARLFDLIGRTPNLDWLLLTKRPENFASMLPWYRGDAPANVWLGVTAENQIYADARIPHLLMAPARIRFLSCEPVLGELDLRAHLGGIGWVIAGNEDAPKPRQTRIEWVRSVRDQCAAAGVPLHIKQWYGPAPDGIAGRRRGKKMHLPVLDGRVHAAFPD